MPVADSILSTAIITNPSRASGAEIRSTWQTDGKFSLAERTAGANAFQHSSNFATASEYHIYFKMDNVIYQVSNATVNQATIDAAVDGIATTTWTGFGTNLIELRGDPRDNAVATFGGILNAGTTLTANSNAYETTADASYHPWNSYNVSGSIASASFIKNRLSTIDVKHAPSTVGAGVDFTFPVTALSFDYNR